jgi:transposase
MGRPILLTPELHEEIIDNLRAGAYVETAAAAAGVNKTTFYEWLKRGARAKREDKWPKADQKFVDFSNAVKRAQADSEMRDLGLIGLAAATNWTAAAWRLERKHPERWGRRERHDVNLTGTLGQYNLTEEEEADFKDRLGKFFSTGEPDASSDG